MNNSPFLNIKHSKILNGIKREMWKNRNYEGLHIMKTLVQKICLN